MLRSIQLRRRVWFISSLKSRRSSRNPQVNRRHNFRKSEGGLGYTSPLVVKAPNSNAFASSVELIFEAASAPEASIAGIAGTTGTSTAR